MANIKVLALALAIGAAGLAPLGCKSERRRDDAQPQQTKTPVTKSETGVPKPTSGGTAPTVGAGGQQPSGTAPSSSGQ